MSWALLQGRACYVSVVTFAIDPRVLRGLVPSATEVDTFDGDAFLSLVALQFADNRLLGLPVPFARRYDQVNLRFYVRRRMDGGEWRHGLTYVREMVPVSSLVSLGHLLYGEAYERLPVAAHVRAPEQTRPGHAVYRWQTDRHVHRLTVDFSGEPRLPEPASREEFLLGRNWGYVAHHADLTREYRIDHPPWRIWPSADAQLSPDVADAFGDRFRRALAGPPISVFVAEGSRVQVHRPATIPQSNAAGQVRPATS
jgi:uncharacterized protein